MHPKFRVWQKQKCFDSIRFSFLDRITKFVLPPFIKNLHTLLLGDNQDMDSLKVRERERQTSTSLYEYSFLKVV